jgi:hypothetical protein
MENTTQDKRDRLIQILTLVGSGLLLAVYFLPAWWVSLTAPQYPKEAFPDGVRINFHLYGTANGCQLQNNSEIEETQALDCVHEMDAINHFVGMYPIATGGVLERFFAPFLLGVMIVMLIGFGFRNANLRTGVLSVGFGALAIWMAMAYYGAGGIKYQSDDYLSAMVVALGQGEEETGEDISPIIALLQRSLEESGESSLANRDELNESLGRTGQDDLLATLDRLHSGSGEGTGDAKLLKDILAEAGASGETGKALNISILRASFLADQDKRPPAVREAWTGSGKQVLFWSYEKGLGRWFNNQDEIRPLVGLMKTVGTLLFFAVLIAMLGLIFLTRKTGSFFYYLLALGPLLLPMFFLMEYAGWLWWYGHSLNDMGAFSLKAFMPTVFGEGKVAQFTTHSYPSSGFAAMLLMSLSTAFALLLRRKQQKAG